MADDRNSDFLGLSGSTYTPFILGVFREFSGFRFQSPQFQAFQNCVEQVIDTTAMLGGDGKQPPDSQAIKFFSECHLLIAVDFVDREEEWFAGADEQACKFEVGSGEFAAAVNQHNDRVSVIESSFGLTKNLGRNVVIVFRQDAAGVDHAHAVPAPFGLAIESVTRDAGLIAHNGSPRTHQLIKERRFPHVGTAYDGDEGEVGGCG